MARFWIETSLVCEVIIKAMKTTSFDCKAIRQWMTLLAVAGMATLLVAQRQEINQLRAFVDAQAEMLCGQQEWVTRAASHLELLHKHEIPYRYLEVLADASEEHGLDLEFMVGLMQVESDYNPNALSDKDAYGLMQIRFPTALEIDPSLESFWQLYNPERNIRLGAAYFRALLDRYGDDYRMAALAYNMGPTRLDGELEGSQDISDLYYRRIRAAGVVN